SDRAIADSCVPALSRVELREPLERRPVGHPRRGALNDEIQPAESGGEHDGGILGDVPALARLWAAREVERAIDPEGADRCDVRPPVGTSGGQEVRHVARPLGGRLEEVPSPRPPEWWAAVDVEVLLFHAQAPSHVARFFAACNYPRGVIAAGVAM